MNAQNCLEILRSIKDVAFATVDRDGKPQVRMIDMMLIEEGKLFFCTARGKDFYQELCDLPEAAITGMNEKYQMVRFNAKREAISRVLKQLEKKGMIQRSCNCMTILDPHGLKQLL